VKAVIKSKKLGVFHGMALTQHLNSLENVHSLLNLVLLKKARLLTLRGEINVQGVGDVQGSAQGKGIKYKSMNMIEALHLSPVKAAFITCFNPLKSLPDTERLKKKLRNTFITYLGSYHNETSKRADVVIPIAALFESEGTITNGERRVRKVNKVIKGPLQLWKVISLFSKKFRKGKQFNYKDSKQVFKELRKKVVDYSKIKTSKLWKKGDAWANKKVKHERFMPESFDGLADLTSKKYPFILTTYRSKFSFLSNEVTKNSNSLGNACDPHGFYMNPLDMKALKLREGLMVKVTSPTGSVKARVYESDRMPRRIIGAYMHYSKPRINDLFPLQFDEESFTPNYKSVDVRVESL
jgi:anaerobic selenocysteine-containing dehydrogenase